VPRGNFRGALLGLSLIPASLAFFCTLSLFSKGTNPVSKSDACALIQRPAGVKALLERKYVSDDPR
jgi:hypothetical protein